MRHALLVLTVLALTTLASADQILLVGGGKLRGRVVEKTDDHVVVEVGPGHITLPASRVVAIQSGVSSLELWRQRRARIAAHDADGWLSLGLWARDAGLHTQAREAFERVVTLQPENPIANAALGRVRHAGRWVSEEERYIARGFMRHRGRWITREEYALELAEQRAEVEERSRRAEADARVREAEARARAAEARADAARSSVPYPGPWSPGPLGLVIGTGGGDRCPPASPPAPTPLPESSRPPARTGSWN